MKHFHRYYIHNSIRNLQGLEICVCIDSTDYNAFHTIATYLYEDRVEEAIHLAGLVIYYPFGCLV